MSIGTPETPTVACGAEPAVVAPPVTPGSTGSGTKHTSTTVTPFVADEAEAEPTATPTPSAEPGDETDSGSEDGVDDKPATASAADFTWLFWAAGLLALLIVAGGAVYFVRRRD